MLDNPDTEEQAVLGAFRYQKNTVVVHNDTRFMPVRKGCWSSWVYLSEDVADRVPAVSLSYWMNQLQNLETEKPVIITLNPGRAPDPLLVHDTHDFTHPMFTLDAVHAQDRIPSIQGRGNVWHCGAYQRYGFHEDGLMSAVAVAGLLGVKPPWN